MQSYFLQIQFTGQVYSGNYVPKEISQPKLYQILKVKIIKKYLLYFIGLGDFLGGELF